MKNLVNTEYITLEQLLESIQIDFKKYYESGIVDEAGLYKVVAYCNQKAGVRIMPMLCEVVEIQNGKAPIPDNFKKIVSVQTISKVVRDAQPNNYYKNWTEHVRTQPHPSIPTYTPMGCHTPCGDCFWVIPYQHCPEKKIVFTEYEDLNLGYGSLSNSEFSIDRDEESLNFGIHSGMAIVTYYADLDSLGLIPKDREIADFYEWSIKEKILQDALMNSEDDVIVKLQYAEKQKSLSYIDFHNRIVSESYRQARARHQQYEQEFDEKWNIH